MSKMIYRIVGRAATETVFNDNVTEEINQIKHALLCLWWCRNPYRI